jgi:hypothetical protein
MGAEKGLSLGWGLRGGKKGFNGEVRGFYWVE